MKELAGVMAAAAQVEGFCRGKGWRFCFIGGIAVQRWGSPRFTQDVDLTLMTGFGSAEAFIDPILQQFEGRLRNARQFAMDHRVLLVRTAEGVHVDFALGAYPFEQASIERATPWEFNATVSLTTCSAEDLLIHKVFASRDRDWGDIESILARQRGRLNLAHIRSVLPALLELKEDTESFDKFEQLILHVNKAL